MKDKKMRTVIKARDMSHGADLITALYEMKKAEDRYIPLQKLVNGKVDCTELQFSRMVLGALRNYLEDVER